MPTKTDKAKKLLSILPKLESPTTACHHEVLPWLVSVEGIHLIDVLLRVFVLDLLLDLGMALAKVCQDFVFHHNAGIV